VEEGPCPSSLESLSQQRVSHDSAPSWAQNRVAARMVCHEMLVAHHFPPIPLSTLFGALPGCDEGRDVKSFARSSLTSRPGSVFHDENAPRLLVVLVELVESIQPQVSGA
jgi:hypothetical protein